MKRDGRDKKETRMKSHERVQPRITEYKQDIKSNHKMMHVPRMKKSGPSTCWEWNVS